MSSQIHKKDTDQVNARLDRWLGPVRASESWLDDLGTQTSVSDPTGESLDEPAAQARRAAHIEKLGALIRQVPARRVKERRQAQWFWGLSAAAALALAVGGGFWAQSHLQDASALAELSPDASLRQFYGQVVAHHSAGSTEILKSGAALHPGDELSTTAEAFASLDVGHARVDVASATTVELLRTERLNQSYKLRAGRVDVSIPKVPGQKQNLEVLTPDTTVRVRGTVFSVAVSEVNGTSITQVQVTRGSVAVEHANVTHMVNAGEQWSSATSEAIEPLGEDDSDRSDVEDVEAPPAASSSGSHAAESAAAAKAAVTSSLRDQNQLFSRALRAQRSGNHRLAVQLYSRLLKRYPDSPLGPTARAELAEARRQLSSQN